MMFQVDGMIIMFIWLLTTGDLPMIGWWSETRIVPPPLHNPRGTAVFFGAVKHMTPQWPFQVQTFFETPTILINFWPIFSGKMSGDMVVSINGVPQNSWLRMENPIQLDNLGVPLFQETFIWHPNSGYIYGTLHVGLKFPWKSAAPNHFMWVKQCYKLPMTGKGKHTTYKKWWFGRWFIVVLPTLCIKIDCRIRKTNYSIINQYHLWLCLKTKSTPIPIIPMTDHHIPYQNMVVWLAGIRYTSC